MNSNDTARRANRYLHELIDDLSTLTQQRDKLLAACKLVANEGLTDLSLATVRRAIQWVVDDEADTE